ncbi:MAG TPA: tripartite tricarboxylate transporter TctB family protein [Casimicrobiaceae bacterium]|nr:tripartite tricarboxylate transporter TctB family protein [Casimicrobiaceae bacterium]
MKINDAVLGVVLLALGVAVFWHVQSFPKIPGQNVGPALFPGTIAAGLIVCAVLLIVSGLRTRPRTAWFEGLPWMRSPRHVAAFAALVLATIAYIFFSTSVGFLIIAAVGLFAMLVAFGVRPLPANLVAIVGTIVIWYAFYKLLRVPLPWGVLQRFAF